MIVWETKPANFYTINMRNKMNNIFYCVLEQWVGLLQALAFENSKIDNFTFKIEKKDHIQKLFIRTKGFMNVLKQSIQDKRDMGFYF